MKNKLLITFLILMCSLFTNAQQNYKALSWNMNTAYNSYLLRTVHQQFSDRKKELTEALSSKQAISHYREDRKLRYKKILGSFPPKTDLNPQITGTTKQKGFRIERVIYESTPDRHVTANLYIPDGKGPFPVALSLSGHGMNGKVSDQKVAALFALNGIACLAIDPIGQGERVQLIDSVGKPLTRGATTEHTLLNAGSNLVGSSLAAYEYWDNVRGIDYLETRKDIDKDKIGCIGSSGGGTQTSYLIALDERIKVATVCSYVSRRERVLELNGPSDGCQHIPGEGKEHLEVSDFLLMFSPKPLLIMSGYYDFVDYWGATQTYDELKKVYKIVGEENKINMFTIEGGHGMPQPKREAAVTWFKSWLLNNPAPVKENENIIIPENELISSSTGAVMTAFSKEVSLPEYNYSLSRQYAPLRAEFMKQTDEVITSQVLDLLGITFPDEKVIVEKTGSASFRTYDLDKYQIIRKGEMPVPCIILRPESAIKLSGNVVLYLNENGKDEILNNESTILNYMNRGDILVLADLRGFGETADPSELNDLKYWSKEYRNAMISLHTGRSIMGQRVIDILSLIDFISMQPNLKNNSISIYANGLYGPAVIHSAFLDKRIKKTEISRSLRSFEQMVQTPIQTDAYSNVLYGVLKYYDLKDLIGKIGNDKIKFID